MRRVVRGDWQPTVTVRACCLCLTERLLSTASTATSSPMLVCGMPPFITSRLDSCHSLTSWCDFCSRCRMLRPGWSLAHDDVTTSHRCFASCTGFQCGSASATRSSRLFIGVCPAKSQATWLTTADSSPTPASDDCVLPTLEHWSSVAHKVLLATEHSLRGSTSALEQFAVWYKTIWLVLWTVYAVT